MKKGKKWWWGYRHSAGDLHLKRYLTDSIHAKEAIEDAYQSTFVLKVVDPFEAKDRAEASKILKERISKLL